MAGLRNTCRMNASLPVLSAANDFDRLTSPRVRFQELAQIWAIDPDPFTVAGPRLWNNLPLYLRDSQLTLL